MQGKSYNHNCELITIECAGCNMFFGITKGFKKARQNDHHNFFCPTGCQNHYPQKTTEEKLLEENKRLKNSNHWLEDNLNRTRKARNHAEARTRGYQGYAAKLKKKAKA